MWKRQNTRNIVQVYIGIIVGEGAVEMYIAAPIQVLVLNFNL